MNKKLIILIFLISTNAFAKLPDQAISLIGKEGVLSVTENGKIDQHLNGRDCTIAERLHYEDSLEILRERYYNVEVTSPLNEMSQVVKNNEVIFTKKIKKMSRLSSKSYCGEFSSLSNYTETVKISENSLSIETKYRCGLLTNISRKITCSVK